MAENDDGARDAAHEGDILREAARARIATQILAGAMAYGGTTFAPILMLDGPINRPFTDYPAVAKRMVENSVALADMLLAELEKREV